MSRRTWLLIGATMAGCLMSAAVMFAIAAAVFGASFDSCEEASVGASVGGAEAPSATALSEIPPERLRLYERAGAAFDIDWTFLASIGTQECASGTCAGVNSSGCAGPMQIAYVRQSPCSPGAGETLWERFAVRADPNVALSVNNPADAIFTAARILRQDMGAPAIGGSYAQYRQAACSYYGACADAAVAYAAEVMARAVQYGFSGAGSPPASNAGLAQPASSDAQGCNSSAVLTGASGASSEIVAIAESQIGQGEHPPGSDCTIYGPCEEWCSLFASWVWQHAGVPLPGATALYGYSGALYEWVARHGGRVLGATATPAAGDAIFYGTGPSDSVHVGIVVEVLSDGEIVTVEGNYAGQVTRIGPFYPADPVGEAGPVYGYGQPPSATVRAAG